MKATGDFDGEGKSDILLQEANGDCYVWLMDGLNAKASAKVGWTPPSNQWRAVGTGDFNGDGKSDILLQDGANGDDRRPGDDAAALAVRHIGRINPQV